MGAINDKVTIVVSSCDKYEDLWDPFFIILKKMWKGLGDIPIVLNTESKGYSYEGLQIKTLHLYAPEEEVSWTQRLKHTLENISTDYVVTLLDDFFMKDNVDVPRLIKNVEWMESNKHISAFYYMETFTPNIRDGKYESFERRPLFGTYKFNCQAALWRRNRLIKYLDHDETPWEWEQYGTWRSYRHPFELFYSQIAGEKYVFPYIHNAAGINFGGLGLFRGRWYLPYVQPLFEKYGIDMDYSIRGVITEEEIRKGISQKPRKKRFQSLRRMYGDFKFIIINHRLILKHFF